MTSLIPFNTSNSTNPGWVCPNRTSGEFRQLGTPCSANTDWLVLSVSLTVSIVSLILVLWSYWQYESFRKHPSTLVQFRALSDLIFCGFLLIEVLQVYTAGSATYEEDSVLWANFTRYSASSWTWGLDQNDGTPGCSSSNPCKAFGFIFDFTALVSWCLLWMNLRL